MWHPGVLRTPRSIRESYQSWSMKWHGRLTSKKAKEDLMNFNNTHLPPIQVQPHRDDDAVLYVLPPDPLHVCLLGMYIVWHFVLYLVFEHLICRPV